MNCPPKWCHVNVVSNWLELLLNPCPKDSGPIYSSRSIEFAPFCWTFLLGPSSKVPLRLLTIICKHVVLWFGGSNVGHMHTRFVGWISPPPSPPPPKRLLYKYNTWYMQPYNVTTMVVEIYGVWEHKMHILFIFILYFW
jgi:hypothetical protein